MMQAIIYFTNKEQLVQDLNMPFTTPEIAPFFVYEAANQKVILVNDQLQLPDFQELIWGLIGNLEHIIYYVFHTHPAPSIKDFLNNLEFVKGAEEDIHELVGNRVSQYYVKLRPLFETQTLTSTYFNTLWAQFDKDWALEEVLEKIHSSWKKALREGTAMEQAKAYTQKR